MSLHNERYGKHEIIRAGRVVAAFDRYTLERVVDVAIAIPPTDKNPDGWAYFKIPGGQEFEQEAIDLLAAYDIRATASDRAAIRHLLRAATPNPRRQEWVGAAVLAAAVVGAAAIVRWIVR